MLDFSRGRVITFGVLLLLFLVLFQWWEAPLASVGIVAGVFFAVFYRSQKEVMEEIERLRKL